MKKEVRQKECEVALKDLQKKIQLKKTKFISGQNGLQACQVAAVEMYLQFVVANGQLSQDASGHAAESWGFAPKWGRRQVRMWTRLWIRMREFPQSLIGQHAKIYLLLSNPEIAAELRAYICSNMWVMDPEKLSKFLKDQLVPKAAEEYLCLITKEEMPWGLKKYMELKLFPHIHLRVGCSISLATAWRWLHSEGFRYTTHKKGLYFDGHDHAGVVEYHQKVFLPAVKAYKPWLVQYVVGDVNQELILPLNNFVKHCLVLIPQDEMASQANDIMEKMWVYKNKYCLHKKGPGCGLHQSDTICSTVGWLKEGMQTLEYGKNYNGYWNGELFVKQVRSQLHCLPSLLMDLWVAQRMHHSCIWESTWCRLPGLNNGW